MTENAQDLDTQVAEAAGILSRLRLVTAFGHVSARSGHTVMITPAADLADVGKADLIRVPLGSTTLPAGAPAEAWAHLALYRARPEVAAIARAQPPAAFAAAAPGQTLTPVYGQACWLGATVPVHDDARLLRHPDLAAAAAKSLPEGEALLLRGNGAITVGDTPGLAVTRMWLLQALCQTWLSLDPPGRRPLDPDEIASWRAAGVQLLPRLWRHLSTEVPA